MNITRWHLSVVAAILVSIVAVPGQAVAQSAPAAGVTVSPTSGLVTTESGGTATFTVVLNAAPAAEVLIRLSSSDPSEVSVSPAWISFQPYYGGQNSWDIPKTITVTGVDDAVVDGNIDCMIVTSGAESNDPSYNGMSVSDVSVTNLDGDVVGITVTPTSGLATTESGGTATFTVVLNAAPAAEVLIRLSSSDPSEVSVSPAWISFQPYYGGQDCWNIPKTITVTGVDDAVVDGDIGCSIITSGAESNDLAYNGLNVSDVSVTNMDNDTQDIPAAGVTVSPTSGLVTTESGGTATFTVVLNAAPAAEVLIRLSSSDPSEVSVSPAWISFQPYYGGQNSWDIPKTITVTGVDDTVVDGNIDCMIVTSGAESNDPAYNGMSVSDVSVTNLDGDVVGITVTPTSGLVTTESGGTATFTVVLNAAPAAEVLIGLSSSDPSEVSVSPAWISFQPYYGGQNSWNIPKTITVTGVDDAAIDGDVTCTIVTAPAVSNDVAYNGLNPSDVAVINRDNDGGLGGAQSPTPESPNGSPDGAGSVGGCGSVGFDLMAPLALLWITRRILRRRGQESRHCSW